METNKFKTVSLDTMIDKHIGKVGTERRDAFENELRIDLLGQAIKQARQERNLTQAQLGELVGVQKAQISKIENSIKNARFETILNVFNALGAKVNFSVELNNRKLGYYYTECTGCNLNNPNFRDNILFHSQDCILNPVQSFILKSLLGFTHCKTNHFSCPRCLRISGKA